MNVKPVTKRHGMKLYKTQAKKKAIVKLAAGNTITYFAEV
jgi:large subunit ribosomal protein L23